MKINKYSPVPVLVRINFSAVPISLYENKVHQWDGVTHVSKNTLLYYLGYIEVAYIGKYAYLIYPEHKSCVICIYQRMGKSYYSCISNDNNDSLDRPLTDIIKDNADKWGKFDEAVLKVYFND